MIIKWKVIIHDSVLLLSKKKIPSNTDFICAKAPDFNDIFEFNPWSFSEISLREPFAEQHKLS